MDVIYVGQEIDINWSIRRNASEVLEDFSKADLKVFLTGNDFDGNYDGKYYFANIIDDQGRVRLVIEAGSLTPGTYCIEGIWIKNSHELLNSGWTRSISRARKDRIFKVSDVEEECTDYDEDEGHVVEASHEINIATGTTSYGYDGMSAYETAVFNGSTAKTEKEWIDTYEKAEDRVNYEKDESHDGSVPGEPQSWANAELKRKQAEGQLGSSDPYYSTSRKKKEEDRQTAESNRASAETSRGTAETQRQKNEGQLGDTDPDYATSRIKKENDRQTAESGRAASESGRVSAENTRVQNEGSGGPSSAGYSTSRIKKELDRQSAEAARELAETARENAKISSTTIEYAVGDSGTTPPSSGWQSTVPSYTTGDFLWGRTTLTFGDGTSKVLYVIGSVPDVAVSQDASTGKTTITVGSDSYDVATEPVSVSQNTLSIGGDDKGKLFGQVIENSEWIWVTTDSDKKIIFGFHKIDGSPYFGYGCPPQVMELLKTKVEKEIGKSLIASVIAESLKVFQDKENRLAITTDNKERIVSYRDEQGKLHEEVGVETKNVESDSVYTSSLILSEQGMSDFQQALKDSGFQPGGFGDYTDNDEMIISEPRLAHLNLLTTFPLTTLSKTSDVKCQVEFFDGAGNYFKKWVILNGQGRSSLAFPKKGLGIDFLNENPNDPNFDENNVFVIKFGNWVPQDSFHVKSFYTDWPRCTTPVVYKLTNEVALTRGLMSDRPYKKYYAGDYSDNGNTNTIDSLNKNMETGARCVPDGFPVIVYQNGVFWGVNSWQLKKHRDNYNLNKKKDTNVHLDGDMGYRGYPSCFWLWDGTIDWTHYCSGSYGIETRNPKNLYCIDGIKYDVDTHNVEIIDTATAEAWLAAGQIIPTGKVIDDTLAGYLRTTGKVRKNIEDLTTYVPYINGLSDGTILIDGQQATTEQIKAAIEERFDVATFIDYILINNVVGNTDCWDNNGQIITWGKLGNSDLLNWSVNQYDCDVTFGCIFDGTVANAATSDKLGNNSLYPLYKIFWDYYLDEMKVRYASLRRAKIFDAEHIAQLFRDWMSRVGYSNYEKEYNKWPESPCNRDGSQTYTKNPTTGGFYGSIYRIFLWVRKRIQYMDNSNFFDYSEN